jgi:hypothetical protein
VSRTRKAIILAVGHLNGAPEELILRFDDRQEPQRMVITAFPPGRHFDDAISVEVQED